MNIKNTTPDSAEYSKTNWFAIASQSRWKIAQNIVRTRRNLLKCKDVKYFAVAKWINLSPVAFSTC